jgi:biopolymer transport protein ExbB
MSSVPMRTCSWGYLVKTRSIQAVAMALALVPVLALAASWWNKDWKYRKEIDFDSSPAAAAIGGSAQDVPVLLRFSLGNFSYFNDTKPDGADFRVVAGDDTTPLKFHIEKYDVQNQMAFIWVHVPQLTGGAKSDKLFAYYGNSDAPAAGDLPGTYDASQTLVLQFTESSGLPVDATAYKNNPSASTAELTTASLIAGGAKFAGKESITVPATPSLRLLPTQGYTASAWVKIEQPQRANILSLEDQGKEITLAIDGSRIIARASMGAAPVMVTQSSDLALAQWHHLAVTAGGGQLSLYVDGAAAGSAPVTLQEIGGALTIGGSARGNAFLTGEMDEVEVSRVARSADWLKAAARSQGIDANLVVYGADGQHEGGGQTSYFVTIAKNLTVDGWVVIGICMAMLAVALVIMVVKAIFLSRVENANRKFLREFHRLSGDARALDDPASAADPTFEDDAPTMAALAADQSKYGPSTLYRLYHHGVFELNKRLAGKAAGAQRAQILSKQSTEAIRAAMDATMTRLQQSLSSQMVLLTIAISGGPFLGLLGTVIGVMITFAAIALSGDVNVNAIAPGTAAALAATVAGLSVAIPALFGYNWLNTRIKSINADNRVFVDEFVTRLAEQYS